MFNSGTLPLNKATTALFIENLNAAVADWNKILHIKGRLKIDILFNKSATPRIDAVSLGNIEKSDSKELPVLEESAAYKIRTGRSAVSGQSDLLTRVNADYLVKEVWLDPQPFTRKQPVPLIKSTVSRSWFTSCFMLLASMAFAICKQSCPAITS